MWNTVLPLLTAMAGVTVGYWVGYKDGLHCKLCTKHQRRKGNHHHQVKWRHHAKASHG